MRCRCNSTRLHILGRSMVGYAEMKTLQRFRERRVLMHTYDTDGHALKQLRQKRGITQKALGAILGLKQYHIARLELGQWRPNAEARKRIAQALGAAEGRLFRRAA